MRGTVMYGSWDVRFEERPDPVIIEPTDAIIRLSATVCAGPTCGPTASRPYQPVDADGPRVLRHRGGSRQRSQPYQASGQFVIGLFFARTTPAKSADPAIILPASNGSPAPPPARRPSTPASRWPMGPSWRRRNCRPPTWSRACSRPLTCSARAGLPRMPQNVKPGSTVAVVGDGAVGLLGILLREADGARENHRDEPSCAAAGARPRTGATDIVAERGDEGVARIKELTNGLGAHSVIEAVGTQESMTQAIHRDAARRLRRIRRRAARRDDHGAGSLLRTCIRTAVRPRCAATCPISST